MMGFMATNHATHDPNRGNPSTMPRISEASPASVYAVNDHGDLCQRCIRCGTWAPISSLNGPTRIRIGTLIRMHNPRLGLRMANGAVDERTLLMFPKTKVGHGCPACVEEFNALVIRYRTARDPFIKVETV